MKPTDHFVGRVYDWSVSKEQFNHLLAQIEHLKSALRLTEWVLANDHGQSCECE